MKAKPNIIVIFSAFAFLFISFVFDNWDLSLRRYAGQTFDFSLTISAQLGITLVFTLLIVGLVLIALVYQEPDRWVYYVALVVSLTLPIPFVLRMIIHVIPTRIPIALTPPPTSYFGLSSLILFWVAVAGLAMQRKKQG